MRIKKKFVKFDFVTTTIKMKIMNETKKLKKKVSRNSKFILLTRKVL